MTPEQQIAHRRAVRAVLDALWAHRELTRLQQPESMLYRHIALRYGWAVSVALDQEAL